MNKKFSTLLAGVALLSAMSANAQTTPAQNVLPTANGAYSIGKLVEGANSGLFQMRHPVRSCLWTKMVFYHWLRLPLLPLA